MNSNSINGNFSKISLFNTDTTINKKSPSLHSGTSNFASLNAKKVPSLNATNDYPPVVFLDECFISFKDSKNKFSNFLNNSELMLEPYIQKSLYDIANNPNKINKWPKSIDFSRKNGKRIKKIMSHYINNINFYKNYVYESKNKPKDKTIIGNEFRTFMIFDPDKHRVIVFMFDPYHLVCPTPDNKKDKDKEETMNNIFNKIQDNNVNIGYYFKDYFKNAKIIHSTLY